MRSLLLLLILLPLALVPSSFADAAAPGSSSLIIEGRVADSSDAIIPSAKVSLLSLTGKVVASTESDANGNFRLQGLVPGTYDLRVEYKGFSSHTQRVSIAEGHGLTATVTMSAAGISETVNVVAQAAYAEPNATSATRMELPLRDIPQTIGVVNAELLRAQGATSMQDAMRNVPAVSVHLGEGRRDQILIRGFSALNDQFVDGVRDDSPYYRDLSNVERIEVVKGPASVLYGRGSSGGLVNRITKSPLPQGVLADLSTLGGSYGNKRTSADFGMPVLNDRLSFRLTGAYEDTGSFRQNFNLERYAVSPSLLWKAAQNSEFVFQSDNLIDQRRPDRGIPSLNGTPAPVNIGAYYGDPAHDYLDNKVYGQTLRFEQHVDRWTIRNNFRHTAYDNSYFNTQATGTSIVNGTVMVSREQYNTTATQQNFFNQTEALTSARLLFGHNLLVGTEYGEQSRDTLRYNGTAAKVALYNPVLTPAVPGTNPSTNNIFDGTVAAVYAQDQIDFGLGFKALIGGRFDYYKQSLDDRSAANLDLKRIDRQFSPRAGLVYQPTHWASVYASFSRSFQPSGEGLSLAANATELKPELTTNYEVGSKFDFFGGRISSTVSLFRLDRDNVKTTDPANPSKLLPLGLQRTEGVDLSVSGRVMKHLEVYGGYAYLDARTVRSTSFSSGVSLQGKRAALVAPHSFNLWSTYSFDNGFGFGGGVFFNDARFAEANNLVTLPSYTRVDATVFYRKRHYEIAANLKNVANSKYFESAQSNYQIMPGSPINGTITTRLRW